MNHRSAVLVMSAAALVACSALGVGDIVIDACWDSRGADGNGCFKCPPSRDRELLNGCGGSCRSFSNTQRIPGYRGTPEVPDVGVVESGPTEAGPPADTAEFPPCASFPNPVYLSGSTALDLTWSTIAKALGGSGTIVRLPQPSCAGIDAMVGRKSATGLATVYGRDPVTACALPAEGVEIDVALSDVSHRECPGLPDELPPGIEDTLGPIQIFLLVVPSKSTQEVISAEAAQRVFGFGGAAGVKPWLADEHILRRHERSGTQIVISKFLGLDPTAWSGTRNEGSSDIVNGIASSTDPEATIAISSPDVAESDRMHGPSALPFQSLMKPLRYQHFGQTCGYHADSTPAGHDKRNVRAGRYALWAPVHMFNHVRGRGGEPVKAIAAQLRAFLLGTGGIGSAAADDHVGVLKTGKMVPACAMRVARDPRLSVSAPMEPFTPAAPCGCAFELASPAATDTSCTRCLHDSDCPANAPRCRGGGCEGF